MAPAATLAARRCVQVHARQAQPCWPPVQSHADGAFEVLGVERFDLAASRGTRGRGIAALDLGGHAPEVLHEPHLKVPGLWRLLRQQEAPVAEQRRHAHPREAHEAQALHEALDVRLVPAWPDLRPEAVRDAHVVRDAVDELVPRRDDEGVMRQLVDERAPAELGQAIPHRLRCATSRIDAIPICHQLMIALHCCIVLVEEADVTLEKAMQGVPNKQTICNQRQILRCRAQVSGGDELGVSLVLEALNCIP
mmetsp:Transcript_131516/g.328015  ORF Transcript_131516/g.328015 Transcript_131516/m.328015 type:complete len:251 (-) Transcript_131516:150-902(-)